MWLYYGNCSFDLFELVLTILYRIEGFTYHEAVLIYALMTAGYVPQCIPTRLPNANIVYELAAVSGAKVLLHHSSIKYISDSPIPAYEVRTLGSEELISVPELPKIEVNPDDVAIIYHTSGSTGNLPKLVRYTGRRLAAVARTFSGSGARETRIWM